MLKEYCEDKLPKIDKTLDMLLSGANKYPPAIFEAMRYSLFAGGKRLRPILLMAGADAVGGNGEDYIKVAAGLEMIHTYSLIHDDLPGMDNDDYRRGKLTNHKVYGEGMAILAGDGLLTTAFEVMLSEENASPSVLIQVVRDIARAAGASGMIAGQTVDLASEGKVIDIDTLKFMHQTKTGALFKAALESGARLAGGTPGKIEALITYAERFGLAFQITDDILDVTGSAEKIGKPIGSDERNHKATYVSLYSLDEARLMAQNAVDEALVALTGFGPEAEVLREMVKQLMTREK
jgi:geranylgeranyl diphosphate synthase type II